MEINLVRKDPDNGYFGRQLWIPKKHVNVRSIKAGLEFPVLGETGIEFLQLWEENDTHILVPREFIPRSQYKDAPFPIIYVGPTHYNKVNFNSRIVLDAIEPDKDIQRRAFKAMCEAKCGLLNLSCLSGDTKIGLNRAGKGFSTTIKEAFYKHKDTLGREHHPWDLSIPTYIRANKNGQIGLQKILRILYQGKKQTYTLTLQDGKQLRLTNDHRVQVPSGEFVPLAKLKEGMEVLVDANRPKSIRKPRVSYRRLCWYEKHPFVRRELQHGKWVKYVIEEHRLVAECTLNGIPSIQAYREIFKSGRISWLKFIDPKVYHVHHKDENTKNNSPDNLEVLLKEKHLGGHRPGDRAFGYGIPTPVKIKSIIPHKVEDVYDIMCDDPHHNFVANGIIVTNCGKGKTQIALQHMAHKQVPALVIVNNTTLIDQWKARIETFMNVDGGIGLVQGDPAEWDWEDRGIVLAMIHSLSLRYEEIPTGFDRYFGNIYYDEVHHLSAPLFVHTAPMFYGDRWGLTATVNREDGLEPIYQYHIGPTFFRDLSQEVKPRIYIQEVPVSIDTRDPDVESKVYAGGKINVPKLRTYLGALPANNDFIAEKLQLPISKKRKILVLSHSVDQLRLLHDRFPDSGLCTGREKPAARIETLRTRQITFGTLQLVKEALDEKTLDTIFFLTPFGSGAVEDGGKNTLQQGMGRILGYRGGGNHPVVVIMDHVFIPKFHKACRQLKKLINEWPADEGGPLEYTILRPFDEQERYKK